MRWPVLVVATLTALAVACDSAAQPTDAGEASAQPPVLFGLSPSGAASDPDVLPPTAGALGSLGCGTPAKPGDIISVIETAQGERSFRVHVPVAYQPGKATPLVLNFHGYARDALQQETYSGLVPLADEETFMLVTPDGAGYPLQWNIVDVYGDSGIDDVSFTAQLVDYLAQNYCLDLHRVYATGISNGGEMAAQVGCLLPDVFAAIAPVAGVVYQACEGRPMPVISFHGTWDFNVPFETAQPAMAEWARHNGCGEEVESELVAPTVMRETYASCNRADVVLYIVEAGGHTWPDAEDDTGGVGPTTYEINANRLMWAFFQAHPILLNPG